MLKSKQLPEAVVYEVFKRCEWDTEREAAEAIAAAINAWPGMDYQPGAMVTKTWRDPGKIILPLPKENNNAE